MQFYMYTDQAWNMASMITYVLDKKWKGDKKPV